MTIGKPVAGICVSTVLFVCGVAGFPTAPANVPPSSGSLVLTTPSGGAVTDVAAGGTFTVSAGGFANSASVTISIYSTPVELAHVVASSSGDVSAAVTVPSALSGTHTLAAMGNAPDGTARAVEATVNVRPATPAGSGLSALPRTGLNVAALVVGGLGLIIAGLVLIRTAVFRRKLLPN